MWRKSSEFENSKNLDFGKALRASAKAAIFFSATLISQTSLAEGGGWNFYESECSVQSIRESIRTVKKRYSQIKERQKLHLRIAKSFPLENQPELRFRVAQTELSLQTKTLRVLASPQIPAAKTRRLDAAVKKGQSQKALKKLMSYNQRARKGMKAVVQKMVTERKSLRKIWQKKELSAPEVSSAYLQSYHDEGKFLEHGLRYFAQLCRQADYVIAKEEQRIDEMTPPRLVTLPPIGRSGTAHSFNEELRDAEVAATDSPASEAPIRLSQAAPERTSQGRRLRRVRRGVRKIPAPGEGVPQSTPVVAGATPQPETNPTSTGQAASDYPSAPQSYAQEPISQQPAAEGMSDPNSAEQMQAQAAGTANPGADPTWTTRESPVTQAQMSGETLPQGAQNPGAEGTHPAHAFPGGQF